MKVLGWGTFWGRHLDEWTLPRALAWAVGAFSIGIFVALLAGLHFDPTAYPAFAEICATRELPPTTAIEIIHTSIELTGVLLLLVAGAFAIVRSRVHRSDEAVLLAVVLPIAAAFEFFHAFASWIGEPGSGDEYLSWTISRTFFSLALLSGAVNANRRLPSSRRHQLMTATTTILAIIAATALLSAPSVRSITEATGTSPVVPHPFDLPALVLFILAATVAWPRLHRRRPSMLGHATLISLLPQILCQIAVVFGSLVPFDDFSVVAHLLKLAGYGTVLLGALVDYFDSNRSQLRLARERHTTESKLLVQTRELERIDRQLEDSRQHSKKIERSLLMLRRAAETMSIGVTVTDLEGKILYVNPADASMHGYEVEELLGRNSQLYSSEPPVGRPRQPDKARPWVRETLNSHAHGPSFPVRLVSDLITDDDGQGVALVTICEDLSERRQIELALESRDRILLAVGFAAEQFLVDPAWKTSSKDVLSRLAKACRASGALLFRGARLEECTQLWFDQEATLEVATADESSPEGAYSTTRQEWIDDLESGKIVRRSFDHSSRPNRSRIGELLAIPIQARGDLLGSLVLEFSRTNREWSEAELEAFHTAARTLGAAWKRRQSDLDLAASEAKFRDVLESASDLIQSVDGNEQFLFVNKAWLQSLGYSEDEVVNLGLTDVLHPNSLQEYRAVVRSLGPDQPFASLEAIFVTVEGREMTTEGNLAGRFEEGRNPTAVRGIFRDITERKIVDRMKQEFVATVSHELRTPLTSIIASLGLLKSGRMEGQSDRVAELLAISYRNSNRLLQLINDLLDLQKIVAGNMRYRIHPVPLDEILSEAVQNHEELATWFGIPLEISDDETGLMVHADRNRLLQVVGNLLSNAIKFSAEGRAVTLSSSSNDRVGILCVRDQGPGIPDEFMERLFLQFTQLDASATRSAGGSGLGLSIVKGLIEGMSGQVKVETSPAGSAFSVELPLFRP